MKMRLIRMHAAIGHKSKQMQLASSGARILHGIEQHGVVEKFAVLDHQLNARRIHVNDPPRPDIQVPNFAVAHLSVGQADVRAASVNQRVRIFAKQAVIGRLAGKRDGIGLGFGAVSPAI